MSYLLTSLLALATASYAAPLTARDCYISCTGAFIIWARGSYEGGSNPSNSTLVPLVNWIQYYTGGSNYEVDYPAIIIPQDNNGDFQTYQSSVETGITDMINHIKSYAICCPNGNNVVLLGYSQGGQVVSDTLGGNSLNASYALPQEYYKYIRAAASFGDPTFTHPADYDAGNATNSGIFQRASNSASENILQYWSNAFRSYCTSGDIVCDDGYSIDIHLSEVATWLIPARKFVLSLFDIDSS